MNILILGGSGILSTDFTKKCLDSGNTVTIVNRGKRKAFIDKRAELVKADIRNESIESLKQKFNRKKCDVVVDFLSFDPEQMKKTLASLKGNYTQYMFISSATVYKAHDGEIITEETEIGNDRWNYAYQKFLCEKELTKSNIYYTIIRPYVTYSKNRVPFPIIPDGFHYSLLSRIKSNKPVLEFQYGKATCTLTHSRDFAEVLYRLLLNSKAERQAFHITSPYRQSWNTVYKLLCDIYGTSNRSVNIDEAQIKIYLPEFQDILAGDKGRNMLFDNSKVLNAIGGYNFKVDLMSGLQETVRFYEGNPEMQGISFFWDGRVDYALAKMHQGRYCSPTTSGNQYSENIVKYYINRYAPLRQIYDAARLIKNKL